MTPLGISGKIVEGFIESKLTPLILIASLLVGVLAVLATPREEEPQIRVPMADVFIPFPGASAKEVENLLTRPVERKLSEITKAEYIYSISRPGMAVFIVRYYVGEDLEKSLVHLYDKLMSNRDLFPIGAGEFMVKPRDINDVPIVTLTLSSDRYDDFEIRRVADPMLEELKKIPGTSGGFIVGGRTRELRVMLDPGKMNRLGIHPLGLLSTLEGVNRKRPSGRFERGNREFLVETGQFVASAEDLERLVVGVRDGKPVYLREAAEITDGPGEAANYVWFAPGRGDEAAAPAGPTPSPRAAVTLALAKLKGINAVEVANAILRKTEELQRTLIPPDIQVAVTRNYGWTADEKADELLKHLLYAVAAVVVFLGLVLGAREAGVVAIAIPVTLALTLFVSMMIGYTINRVTLFALIFSIGILVDDAIVVVENIYRHLRRKPRDPKGDDVLAEILAVDEVGNPTILATFTVIAALLPMAFVSGLMGPYMRPIPVNASIAMFFSLLVAFIIVPWFCRICYLKLSREGGMSAHDEPVEATRVYRFYHWLLTPLMENRLKRVAVLGAVAGLLAASLSLFYFKVVVMKMLPFDNKSELQLVIDMPEGTPLEETDRVGRALGAYLQTLPEVENIQIYAGTSSPFNFNGLVRHYFLREGSHEGDIQISLVDKHRRAAQSHDIALRIRPEVRKIADRLGADVKVVEVPPGPPVQSVLVAEVYGPDDDSRNRLAREVRRAFEASPGVVDVDDSLEAEPVKYRLEVDQAKAALAGIPSQDVVRTLSLALAGETASLAHIPEERNPVPIRLRLPRPLRSGLEELGQIYLQSSAGRMVPVSELVKAVEEREENPIHHKNLKSVAYVTADVAGQVESPVYAILNLGPDLAKLKGPDGKPPAEFFARQPDSEEGTAVKWDGEWQITYETFRDMGIAFGVALLLIYLLIVGQFQSFSIPLVIMAPIPLTLIGILPGHWLFNSYFTATSMIGFIALAGIIVRNSILLVDFIRAEEQEGTPLKEAVIRAGAIRTRPILLTAAALMVGAFVIVLDPIFQGLAVSLLFGVFSSTLLTLVVIPLLYYWMAEKNLMQE